jgi:hypothetical protein
MFQLFFSSVLIIFDFVKLIKIEIILSNTYDISYKIAIYRRDLTPLIFFLLNNTYNKLYARINKK